MPTARLKLGKDMAKSPAAKDVFEVETTETTVSISKPGYHEIVSLKEFESRFEIIKEEPQPEK